MNIISCACCLCSALLALVFLPMCTPHSLPTMACSFICCTEIGWDDEGQFGQHRTAVFLMPGDHEASLHRSYWGLIAVGLSQSTA